MIATRLKTGVLGPVVFGATVFLSRSALAAPCPTDLENPIYGAGGSAATATIKQIAIALAGLPSPITVLWHDPGACIGFTEFVNGTIPSSTTTTLKYWDANGTEYTCEPPTAGLPVQFSHMGNTADFCVDYPDGQPDGIGDFLAPVQSINVITDRDSSQRSISSEALYHIWGLGAAEGGVSPWTNPSHVVLRTTSSFVHQVLAEAVFGNYAKVFYDHPTLSTDGDTRLGVQVQTNGASVAAVVQAGANSPETPLAYVSGSAADTARDQIKTLAYQHYGQSCAYWPDSSESALDKLNVRQGVYALWNPGHLFAEIDDDGEIVNPVVREFIGYFTGELDSPQEVEPPLLERIIQAGDIPLCAMEVTREGTLGAISSYAPDRPCGCYFETVATGAAPERCDACDEANGNDDCSDGQVCRYGFCEAY